MSKHVVSKSAAQSLFEKLSRAPLLPAFLPSLPASSFVSTSPNSTFVQPSTGPPSSHHASPSSSLLSTSPTPSATPPPAHLVFGSSRTSCVRRCYLSATLLSPPFWGSFHRPLIARTHARVRSLASALWVSCICHALCDSIASRRITRRAGGLLRGRSKLVACWYGRRQASYDAPWYTTSASGGDPADDLKHAIAQPHRSSSLKFTRALLGCRKIRGAGYLRLATSCKVVLHWDHASQRSHRYGPAMRVLPSTTTISSSMLSSTSISNFLFKLIYLREPRLSPYFLPSVEEKDG